MKKLRKPHIYNPTDSDITSMPALYDKLCKISKKKKRALEYTLFEGFIITAPILYDEICISLKNLDWTFYLNNFVLFYCIGDILLRSLSKTKRGISERGYSGLLKLMKRPSKTPATFSIDAAQMENRKIYKGMI